jgi:hypothetical protein
MVRKWPLGLYRRARNSLDTNEMRRPYRTLNINQSLSQESTIEFRSEL